MMRDIWTVFMAYCGNGILPFLFFAALVYLLITEKDRKIRLVLLESSAVITLLFFFPLFKMIMDKVEEAGTYYRILWLLPMTIVIAYAGVRLIGTHTRVGLVLAAAVLILSGEYLYTNINISEAQNRFHLPNEVIAICDTIAPSEDEERVWAVFPSELIHYVRQYTSDIQMPYGRDMLVASWDHVDHPLYLEMEGEWIEAERLAELADESSCHYVILNRNKPVDGDLADFRIEKMAEIGHYDIYRNMDVPIVKKNNL